jgi:hypothetical protein
MDNFEISDFAADDLIDADGDGTNDTVAIDTDDDGTPEGIFTDTTGDGIIDTGIIDTDGDGVADLFVADRDQDGTLDEIVLDADRDGFFDNVDAPSVPGAVSAPAPIDLVGPTASSSPGSAGAAPASQATAVANEPSDSGSPGTASSAPAPASEPNPAANQTGPQPIDLAPVTGPPTSGTEPPQEAERGRPTIAEIRRSPGARHEDREIEPPTPATDAQPAEGEA